MDIFLFDFMAKYTKLKVSDEVVGILRAGGSRCDSFLKTVAEHQSAITAFCKKGNLRLTEVDVGVERAIEEPSYYFSDGLGGYTIDGIRNSLN